MATADEVAAQSQPLVDRASGETTLAELLATLPPDQAAAIDHIHRELREAHLATLAREVGGSTAGIATGSNPTSPATPE